MKLTDPFFIGPHLAPALSVGPGCTLTLLGVVPGERDRAVFHLKTHDFEYEDDKMLSGVHGFRSTVETFDGFLSFLEAAAESLEYEVRTGAKGENSDLFPTHVVEWALENKYHLEDARLVICDEDGYPLTNLIEE